MADNMNIKEINLQEETAVIRSDFMTFCDYISEHSVEISKRTGNIGRKDRTALGELLDKPQDADRIINFFYYVALKHGIIEKTYSRLKLKEGINYQLFKQASVCEQYMLFLVNFLYDGRFNLKTNTLYRYGDVEDWSIYIADFFIWMDDKQPVSGKRYEIREFGSLGSVIDTDKLMPFLEELNIFKVLERPGKDSMGKARKWKVEAMPMLEVLSVLYKMEIDDDMYGFYEEYVSQIQEDEVGEELPNLFYQTEPEDLSKTIDFEVKMRKKNRSFVIRMNLGDTLYDLHKAIRKAVKFDDDHLFQFEIGVGMFKKVFVLSEIIDNPWEEAVEDMCFWVFNFHKGDEFTYLYDFGDMWWFDIKVLCIN
jgi:hypothetical protein